MLRTVHLSAFVLPLVTALLLEELTFGGLVRLILAPWPQRKPDQQVDRKRDPKRPR